MSERDEVRGRVLAERELEEGLLEREYGDDGTVETRTPSLPIALIEATRRRVRAWREQR